MENLKINQEKITDQDIKRVSKDGFWHPRLHGIMRK